MTYNRGHYFPFIIIFCLLLTSCATGKLYLKPNTSSTPENPGKIEFSIYGVGDAGEINQQSKEVIRHLSEVAKASHPGLIIFLGDNVYPEGMPPEWSIEEHHQAQDILMNQIFGLDSFPGDIIFLPGNHDWQEGKVGGLETIKRQGQFLSSLNDSRIKMLPQNGCGGPVTMSLTKDIELIMFDSQWWIEDWANEPMINQGCTIDSREEFIKDIEKLIELNRDKQIVFAMHHPLYSQGPHGGHYTFRDHMFPLSKVVKWLYLPLPVSRAIIPHPLPG